MVLGVEGRLLKSWVFPYGSVHHKMDIIDTVIYSTIACNTLVRYVRKSVHGSGFISPLIWLLDINKVTIDLNRKLTKVIAYSEDTNHYL